MLLDQERKTPESEDEPRRDWSRTILRYTPILIGIAAIYAGFMVWSRWSGNRAFEAREKAQAAAQQRAEDQRSLETLGGSSFDILNFYASPGLIHRGDTTQLCYGVANAQSVKIEPETNRALWPSVNRCVEIAPKKTTTYTLTADDGQGKNKTATLTIEVH